MATIAQIQDKIDLRIDGGDNPISSERELWELLLSQQFIGEVKWIKMDVADIPSYFIVTGGTTGLGKTGTPYEGWAWCNGNNGTTNDDGRVSIAYGTNYPTTGATGGDEDSYVIEHDHTMGIRVNTGVGGVQGLFDQASGGVLSTYVTSTEGISGVGLNMQPYVVELKIVRIA